MLFFAVVFAGVNMPLFADIESSNTAPTCDYGTLAAYSGDVDLKAEYEANVIELHWYNQDTEIAVQAEAQTCTYDTTFPLPSEQPTRAGYQFGGWQVVNPLRNLDVSTGGSVGYSINLYNGTNRCRQDTTEIVCSNAAFNDLTVNKWKEVFDYGTLYGVSKCSSTPAGQATTGTPENTAGGYCWCHATGFIPVGETDIKTVPNSPWVAYGSNPSQGFCEINCPSECTTIVGNMQSVRREMYR